MGKEEIKGKEGNGRTQSEGPGQGKYAKGTPKPSAAELKRTPCHLFQQGMCQRTADECDRNHKTSLSAKEKVDYDIWLAKRKPAAPPHNPKKTAAAVEVNKPAPKTSDMTAAQKSKMPCKRYAAHGETGCKYGKDCHFRHKGTAGPKKAAAVVTPVAK